MFCHFQTELHQFGRSELSGAFSVRIQTQIEIIFALNLLAFGKALKGFKNGASLQDQDNSTCLQNNMMLPL